MLVIRLGACIWQYFPASFCNNAKIFVFILKTVNFYKKVENLRFFHKMSLKLINSKDTLVIKSKVICCERKSWNLKQKTCSIPLNNTLALSYYITLCFNIALYWSLEVSSSLWLEAGPEGWQGWPVIICEVKKT